MQFRLTYEGPLKSSGNKKPRPDHKHEIRAKLHPQLERFWKQAPFLEALQKRQFHSLDVAQQGKLWPPELEPVEGGKNDARVIITVNVRPMISNWLTMGFVGT